MLVLSSDPLQAIQDFLQTPTPEAWLNKASENIPLLLIDHAHCERKAALSALNFISKYSEKSELIGIMSPLAREELLHFEKVLMLLRLRNIAFKPLLPSIYAQHLHREAAQENYLDRLRDQLIIGAIIEARSCERFHALLTVLKDKELIKFYQSLVKAEARHFEQYLNLAMLYGTQVEERLSFFIDLENKLITSAETIFRFHSGTPCAI